MKTYIAILRGINVGGKRIVKMEALREMMAALKFKNVETYIQSGNVIFQSKEDETKTLGKQIEKSILKTFSYEVPVIVIDIKELMHITSKNPMLKDKSKNAEFMHVTFLMDEGDADGWAKIKAGQYGEDVFEKGKKAIYLYCPNGYHSSKLTNGFFETKLKTTATTRNWKTSLELQKIAERISLQ